MNKNKILIFLICICVLLIMNKLFLYSKYSVDGINKIEKVGDTTIEHKDTKDYLNYNGIRIRNDFKKYTYEEDEGSYVLYNKDEEITNTFTVFEVDTLVYLFKEYDNNIINKKRIEVFLKDNNINNDIDLIEYLSNYKEKVNVFTPTSKIRFNYYIHNYIKDILPLVDEYKIINGDYSGIILFHNNYEEEKALDLMLLNDDRRFVLSFTGFDIDENSIIDLVGTVIFNEKEQ